MIIIKFIFPQNYDFKTKLLGIIDYQTAILNAIWIGIVLLLLNTFFNNINIKIFLFIIFTFPVILLSIIGINGENIFYVISYMSKFILKEKLLFYKKGE